MLSKIRLLLVIAGIVLQIKNARSLFIEDSELSTADAYDDDHSSYYFQRLIDMYSHTAIDYNSISKTSDIRCLMCNKDDLDSRNEVIDILAQIGDVDDIQTFITLIFKHPIKNSAKSMLDKMKDRQNFDLVKELEEINNFHMKMGNVNYSKVMNYFFGMKITSEEYLEDQPKYIEQHIKAQDIMEWMPHYLTLEQMPVPNEEQMSGHVKLVKKIDESNTARINTELLNDRCIEDMKQKYIRTASLMEEFDIHLTSSSSDLYKPPVLDSFQYSIMKTRGTIEIISEIIPCYPLWQTTTKDLTVLLKIVIANHENKNSAEDSDEDSDQNEKLMEAAKGIYAFCDYQETQTQPISKNSPEFQTFKNNRDACKNVTDYTAKYAPKSPIDWDSVLVFYECKLNISFDRGCDAVQNSAKDYFEDNGKSEETENENVNKTYKEYEKLAKKIEKIGILGDKSRNVRDFNGNVLLSRKDKRLLKIYERFFADLDEIAENIANVIISSEGPGLTEAKKLGKDLTKALIAPFKVLKENSVSKEKISKLHGVLYMLVNSFNKYILENDFDTSAFEKRNYQTGRKRTLCEAYSKEEIVDIGKLMLGITDFQSPSNDEDEQDRINILSLMARLNLPKYKSNVVFDSPAYLERHEKRIPHEILGVIITAAEKANPINKLEIEKSMRWANENLVVYVKDTPKAMFDTSESIIRGCTLTERDMKASINCRGINDLWVLATLKRLDTLGYGQKEIEFTLNSVSLIALPGFVSEWNIKTLIINSALLPINGPNDIPSKVENIGIKELPADLTHIRRGNNYLMFCSNHMKTYEELKECATNPAKFNLKQKIQRVKIDWDVVYEIFKMKTLPSGELDRKYTSPIPAQVTLDLVKSKFKHVELMNVLANIKTGQTMGASLTEFIYNSLWTYTHREICDSPRKIFYDRDTKALKIWNYNSCVCNPEVATYVDSNDDGPQDDRLEALKMFLIIYGEHIAKTAATCLILYLVVQIITYKPPSIPNDLRSNEFGSGYGDPNFRMRVCYLFKKAEDYIKSQRINKWDIENCADEFASDARTRKLAEALASGLYRQREAYTGNE